MLYLDVDGVIRDLQRAVLGELPDQWNCYKYGIDFCSIINNDLSVLLTAEPTEYYEVIKKIHPLRIISCQPKNWRDNTGQWLKKHFGYFEVLFVESPEDKLDMLYDGDWLVEDYPLFNDYKRIILIDRPYNRDVAADRVKTPEELEAKLRSVRYEW